MYSEGRPTEETKRAYGGMEERGERAREEVQARAFEYEENLSVIRETLYSGEFCELSLRSLSVLPIRVTHQVIDRLIRVIQRSPMR